MVDGKSGKEAAVESGMGTGAESEKKAEDGERWEDAEWAGWAGEVDRMDQWSKGADGTLGRVLGGAAELSGQSRLVVWAVLVVGAVVGLEWLGTREAGAVSLVLSLAYPLSATLAVMEVAEARVQAEWLFFWLLWATAQLLPGPGLRLAFSVWLAHPATRGKALLYKGLARPLVLLQHGLVSPGALGRLEPRLAGLLGLELGGLAAPEPAVLARAGLALHRPPPAVPTGPAPPTHIITQLPAFVSRLHLLARISKLAPSKK